MSNVRDVLRGDHEVPKEIRELLEEGPVVQQGGVQHRVYPGLTHRSRLDCSTNVGVGEGGVGLQQPLHKSTRPARQMRTLQGVIVVAGVRNGVVEDEGLPWLPLQLLEEVMLAAGLVRAAASSAALFLALAGAVLLHPLRFLRTSGARVFLIGNPVLCVLTSSSDCEEE